MGLFNRAPARLPRTAYGYQPPPEAIAVGWQCYSCAQGGDPPPRRWPVACPDCGQPLDPTFPEPWAHEALGVEIRHRIEHSDAGDGGFWSEQLLQWRFQDALLRGDRAASAAVRHEFRALAVEQPWAVPAGYFRLVWRSVEAGDLDAAADDLLHWHATADGTGAETDSGVRHNVKNALDSTFRFLDAPGAGQHPQRAAVVQASLTLSAEAYSVFTPQQQARILELSKGAA